MLGAGAGGPGVRRAGRSAVPADGLGSAPHWPPGSSGCFICSALLGGAVRQTREEARLIHPSKE